MCSSVGFAFQGFYASWTWLAISFLMLGKFSTIISWVFSLSLFSFWDHYNVTVVWLICPRGLLGCLHFFSFFFLYSVLQQQFLPFCPPGHLSILLHQLFCYWFLLPYFSSFFFSSASSLVNISCNFSIFASPPTPKILDHLYYYYSEFFFSGSLHISTLFIVPRLPHPLGFYSVPSSGMKPSAFSSWLTFCWCGFGSSQCEIVILLASSVCPLVVEAKWLV